MCLPLHVRVFAGKCAERLFKFTLETLNFKVGVPKGPRRSKRFKNVGCHAFPCLPWSEPAHLMSIFLLLSDQVRELQDQVKCLALQQQEHSLNPFSLSFLTPAKR